MSLKLCRYNQHNFDFSFILKKSIYRVCHPKIMGFQALKIDLFLLEFVQSVCHIFINKLMFI